MSVSVVDMKLTGMKIAFLREQRGISVRELQRMLGMGTPQAIYKWQRGETLPSIENLAALACAFGVSIDEILSLDCRKLGE